MHLHEILEFLAVSFHSSKKSTGVHRHLPKFNVAFEFIYSVVIVFCGFFLFLLILLLVVFCCLAWIWGEYGSLTSCEMRLSVLSHEHSRNRCLTIYAERSLAVPSAGACLHAYGLSTRACPRQERRRFLSVVCVSSLFSYIVLAPGGGEPLHQTFWNKPRVFSLRLSAMCKSGNTFFLG